MGPEARQAKRIQIHRAKARYVKGDDMKTDNMQIEVLDDGTIKVTTGPISGANHANAEAFLQFVSRMAAVAKPLAKAVPTRNTLTPMIGNRSDKDTGTAAGRLFDRFRF